MSGDPLALLATVMLPVTAPVAAGANFTESVAVPDGSSVVGGVIATYTEAASRRGDAGYLYRHGARIGQRNVL